MRGKPNASTGLISSTIYEKGQTAIPEYDTAPRYYNCDPVTLALPAKVGEVLDIVWLNDSGKSGGLHIHPFHAHGSHYWDLGSGNGTCNAAENEEKFRTEYVPVKRDTTMPYRYAASWGDIYDRWMEGLEDQASEPGT